MASEINNLWNENITTQSFCFIYYIYIYIYIYFKCVYKIINIAEDMTV